MAFNCILFHLDFNLEPFMTQTTPLSKLPIRPAGSPISSPSKTTVISTLAKLKMPKASSPEKPLTAKKVISKTEIKLLEAESPEKARELYTAILNRARGVLAPAMSLFVATCEIGLALTYDTGSDEREQWVLKAKQDIDKVFANTSSWEMSQTEVIETYRLLRNSLEHVRLLMPKHASTLKDIDTKLEECKKNIPETIEDFDPLVQIADLCVSYNDSARAEKYFIKALTLIDKEKESSYRLSKAECLLKYAAGYPVEHPQRHLKVLLAQDAVFALEGLEEELCQDKSKISGITLRLDLLKRLLDLTPETLESNRPEMKEKLKACEEKLKALSPTDLSPRKVTKGPDSGLFRNLFALFALAVFALSAVAFYRRYIVKIN